MQLCDFTSWIQLSATLNIAFVAVEYAKSCAKVIYNHVFNISKMLEERFNPCVETLGDEETVNHLVPRTIEDCSTNNKIEEIKRTREILITKINTTKSDITDEINEKCNTRSTSAISLFVFFYSLSGLFLVGVEPSHPLRVHAVWGFLSVGVLLYLIFGWICGEQKWKHPVLDFATLRHPLLGIIVLLVAAVVAGCCSDVESLKTIDARFWTPALIASLILMFLNFVIFLSNIGVNAGQLKSTIRQKSGPIKNECTDWRTELNQLLTLEKLHAGLTADPIAKKRRKRKRKRKPKPKDNPPETL